MDSRAERSRHRVMSRLCLAAYVDFNGMPRSELARTADSNDYRRGGADVDRMLAEGDLEWHGKRLRLTRRAIDEVAYSPAAGMVTDFFNLDKPYARELRRERIAANGADVLMPSERYPEYGDEPRFPRYNIGPFYGLSEAEVQDIVKHRNDSTPEPKPVVWEPEQYAATPHGPLGISFWEQEHDAIEAAAESVLEPSGFWS